MCGIAGYVGLQPPNMERVAGCESLMWRRGPDAIGRYINTLRSGLSVTLLHSRLAIIDLDSRANQPMRRGSHVIGTNGELYNYHELRKELRKEEVTFATDSDTEVLLAGIIHWGIDVALSRSEGMWAFAVIDERACTVTLARDRFGEKPLHLMETSHGIFFGSEVKFLFSLSGQSPVVNHEHLKRFLVNGYKALHKVSATFHKGVRALPGSSLLHISLDSATERRYWSPTIASDDTLTIHEAIETTRHALIKAVDLRLRSDVPVAFCLSGGIDSNAIVAIASRQLGHDVHGFTILNTDARYEESDLVDKTVKELGIKHTFVKLSSKNFLSQLRILVRQHDAPVFTLSYYVHWLLMEAVANQNYKVVLSGTGADEFFTGYYDHHNAFLYEIRENVKLWSEARANWQAHIASTVRNPFLQNPDLFLQNAKFRDHIYFKAAEFSKALVEPWSEPFTETRYCDGLLRNRMMNELFHESIPVILHEDDLNAMYFSIENRSPFLDKNLFETAAHIPTQYLICNGYTKAVLREAIRGIAPDQIINNRRKIGFNVPIGDLLDIGNSSVREELLDNGPIFDLVRRDAVESLLKQQSLPNSQSKFLFNILCVRFFLEDLSQPVEAPQVQTTRDTT